MVEKIYQDIKEKVNLRENLAQLRQQIKEEANRQKLLLLLEEDTSGLVGLLEHTDPKVRKSAALILGEAKAQRFLHNLFQAYQTESTLFVKSAYLKAISHLDYGDCLRQFQARLEELTRQKPEEDEKKHIREEMAVLQKLLLRRLNTAKHVFTGMDKRYQVVLTTNRLHREVTARQIPEKNISLIPAGVKIKNANLNSLIGIRTYRELLFLLECPEALPAEPEQTAEVLAASNLLELLNQAHDGGGTFYFRLSIAGGMPLDKRSDFIKKCSYALEQLTKRKLVNTASDYEIEIRLMERRDGTFIPFVKMFTLKDERFCYRKWSVSASLQPSVAALLALLAKPYLKEHAQVLDPFCGVGTMLIERDEVVKAGTMYGLDIFGEAVDKARENTRLAQKEIYYVHKDYFDFKHDYLFEEIFTNMPVRGRSTKEEQDLFYQRFFEKALTLLKPDGILILYSNEMGFIKKQLRLNDRLKLFKEYCLNDKDGYSLYIIGQRG